MVAAGIFVCCGAGRLARYNLITTSDKRFFVGMPIPMAGLIAASDIQASDANNAGLFLELDAILCVDTARAGTSELPPSDVLTFTKVLQADVLLACMRARKHHGLVCGNLPETWRRVLPKIDNDR